MLVSLLILVGLCVEDDLCIEVVLFWVEFDFVKWVFWV